MTSARLPPTRSARFIHRLLAVAGFPHLQMDDGALLVADDDVRVGVAIDVRHHDLRTDTGVLVDQVRVAGYCGLISGRFSRKPARQGHMVRIVVRPYRYHLSILQASKRDPGSVVRSSR